MRIRFKDVEIGQRKTTTFQINNVGGIYTNIWIDNQPAPWLSVIAAKSTGAEQLPLEVTIECNGVGEEGKYDLYVMNSDGTNIVNVTPDYFPPDFLCHTPVFSMDDSRIYFIGEWWE
jgi:hypothetical protein